MNQDDFDNYRAKYPKMGFQDVADAHEPLWSGHPEQQHYNLEDSQKFFGLPAINVLEIGGWDGELAGKMLEAHKGIETWTNLEICNSARESSVCSDPRYFAPQMTCFPWDRDLSGYDTLYLSHVLEHISLEQIERLFARASDAERVYVDLPADHHLSGSTSLHITKTSEVINALADVPSLFVRVG